MNKTVSIVTLNYNGKQYLQPLFESLQKQTYQPCEIVMVDNASVDGSVEFVEQRFPNVRIIRNSENVGFAGGNNSALRHCRGEYIALINNDMIADERYIEWLVRSLEEQQADVTGGKILFYTPFVTLRVEVKTFVPNEHNGGGDVRALGCMIASDIAIDDVPYKKNIFLANTFGEEKAGELAFHWLSNEAVIKIPVDLKLSRHRLRMKLAVSDMQKEEEVTMRLGEEVIFQKRVSNQFSECTVDIDPALIKKYVCHVVNNASSEFNTHSGGGRDVGIYEDDKGQYDTPHTAQAICGGSMLIRREVIDRYGLFDDYFFAYYEDTDFSWRLNRAGKKLFFEPRAFVYHVHTGTSKEWSPFFRYHVERNRLAMLLKNARLFDAAREWGGFFLKTARDAWRMVRRRVFKRQPKTEADSVVWIHLRVCGDLLLHIPALLWKRLYFVIALEQHDSV
ncbi:MAG: glycosyltransferase family 2 protein [Candidatus Kerfeldbacteria bacterium]|nr:glycosyltransferase family 2 protein [Candidatus Kerfeldbacteria bacterium]